jgi:SAM-dependent methyltransferase
MKWSGWIATMEKSRSWLVNSIGNRALRESMPKYLHGDLIDIGCGTKPMHSFTSNLVKRHIGIDQPENLHGTKNVDVHSNAYHTPFKNCAFDSAICTAVLEHLEEPLVALRECFRLLKPGGSALYTVPFIWHLHEEPRDFFRYSKYGLIHLFQKAGFEKVEVRALSGFWVTFGQLLVYNLFRLNRGPLKYLPIIPALGMALQFVFLGLDKLDKTEIWTWAYLVVAKKSGSGKLVN